MKLYAIAPALALLAGASAQTTRPPRAPAAAPPRADAALPKASVAEQPDAPLAVSVPEMRLAGEGAILDVYIVVRNTVERGVTAYGTRSEFESAAGRREECYRFNVLSPGKIILRGQTDGKSRFHGVARGAEPKSVRVSLDFVEFADGPTWGPDACRTAESLAAERRGGGAALEELRRVLKEGGPQAVVEAVRSCEARFAAPEELPERLQEAFRAGAGSVCWRVLRAHEQEGLTEVAATLDKPYDASGAGK